MLCEILSTVFFFSSLSIYYFIKTKDSDNIKAKDSDDFLKLIKEPTDECNYMCDYYNHADEIDKFIIRKNYYERRGIPYCSIPTPVRRKTYYY